MLTPLQNVSMQFGHVEFSNVFEPDCEPGDWQYENVFTGFSEPPRVILTASDFGAEQSSGQFIGRRRCRARRDHDRLPAGGEKSDRSPGVAHMNWLALLETGKPQASIKHVRMGTLFPKRFRRDCEPGDWNTWDVRFSEPAFGADPVIFATAADRFAEAAAVYEHGDFSGWVRTNYAMPAAPVVRKRTTTGFTLMARNPDPGDGWSNFTPRAPRNRGGRGNAFGRRRADLCRFRAGDAALVRAVPTPFPTAPERVGGHLRSAFLAPPTVLLTAFHAGRSVRPWPAWPATSRRTASSSAPGIRTAPQAQRASTGWRSGGRWVAPEARRSKKRSRLS